MEMFSTSEHCLSIQYAVCTINIAIHAKFYVLSAFLCIVSFYNKNVHAFDHNYGRIQLKGSMLIYVRFAGLHKQAQVCQLLLPVKRSQSSQKASWLQIRNQRIEKPPCVQVQYFGAVGQPLTFHSIISIFAWWHVNVIVRGSTYLS